jgi:hypothetical protein
MKIIDMRKPKTGEFSKHQYWGKYLVTWSCGNKEYIDSKRVSKRVCKGPKGTEYRKLKQ